MLELLVGIAAAAVLLTAADGQSLIKSQLFGTSGDDRATQVAVYNDGSYVVIGTTYDNMAAVPSGALDIVATRYTGNGTQVWQQQYSTAKSRRSSTFPSGVAIDNTNGDIVISGHIGGQPLGTVTVGYGTSAVGGTPGGSDHFLYRVSGANGAMVWATQFGTAGVDEGYEGGCVAIDQTDRSIVFVGTSQIRPANQLWYLSKHNFNNGAQIWQRFHGPTTPDNMGGNSQAQAIAVHPTDHSIVVTGTTGGRFAWPGQDYKSGFSQDAVTAKFNSANGDAVWARQAGARFLPASGDFPGVSGSTYPKAVAIDRVNGQIVVAGYASGNVCTIAGNCASSGALVPGHTCTANWRSCGWLAYCDSCECAEWDGSASCATGAPNGPAAFVMRYSATGQLLWTRQRGGRSKLNAVAIDPTDQSIVCAGAAFRDLDEESLGTFSRSIFEGSSELNPELRRARSENILMARWRHTGAFLTARTIGGAGSEGIAQGLDCAIDPTDQSVLVVGYVRGNVPSSEGVFAGVFDMGVFRLGETASPTESPVTPVPSNAPTTLVPTSVPSTPMPTWLPTGFPTSADPTRSPVSTPSPTALPTSTSTPAPTDTPTPAPTDTLTPGGGGQSGEEGGEGGGVGGKQGGGADTAASGDSSGAGSGARVIIGAVVGGIVLFGGIFVFVKTGRKVLVNGTGLDRSDGRAAANPMYGGGAKGKPDGFGFGEGYIEVAAK